MEKILKIAGTAAVAIIAVYIANHMLGNVTVARTAGNSGPINA